MITHHSYIALATEPCHTFLPAHSEIAKNGDLCSIERPTIPEKFF